MNSTLKLTKDTKLEFAFGSVIEGKEHQVFAEYFPLVGPVIAEYGSQQLATFAILASNVDGVKPTQGAISQWPEVKGHEKLVGDERFARHVPIRDEAMDLLSDGHIFDTTDNEIEISSDEEYGFMVSSEIPSHLNSLVQLDLAEGSFNQEYSDRSLVLFPWSSDAEKLLERNQGDSTVLKVQFNPQ
ncbi:MAG: hypothetical protein AAF702_29530 [Chloroflexota bacterium]